MGPDVLISRLLLLSCRHDESECGMCGVAGAVDPLRHVSELLPAVGAVVAGARLEVGAAAANQRCSSWKTKHYFNIGLSNSGLTLVYQPSHLVLAP